MVVDQDSLADVVNCVAAVLRTFQGQRLDAPGFGIEDPTFKDQPIELQSITEAVLAQEPRATLLMEQNPDQFDQLIADVVARVSTTQEVSNGQ